MFGLGRKKQPGSSVCTLFSMVYPATLKPCGTSKLTFGDMPRFGGEEGIFVQAKEKRVNEAVRTYGLKWDGAVDDRRRGHLICLAKAQENVFKSRKKHMG